MKKRMFLRVAFSISVLGFAPVSAQTSDRPDGMRFVPDVAGQFAALTERGDALGFHIGGSPDPSGCKHYQGMTRVDGADGTPFFLVTRSGILPDTFPFPGVICNDSDGETDNGNLIVFRMGSRDKNGERLRSNRLRKGMHLDNTPPPPEDRATIYFTVVGGDPNDPDPANRPGLVLGDGESAQQPRVYQHPGGMQLIGHMLAMAVEGPRDLLAPPALIMFFDVSDPEAPVFTSQYVPVVGQAGPLTKAGIVAVTPLPGGRYLMAITGGRPDDERAGLSFFRSTSGDLSSPDLGWELVRRRPGPDVEDAHQTLQFLREGDINGQLYLAGARGHVEVGPLFEDRDRIDLYTVDGQTPDYEPSEFIELGVRFNGRRITPRPSTGGNHLLTSLAAGSGFHVTPSGELILYATTHDNEGPDGTVDAGEWRHIDMVRENSPTLLPTVVVNGPYEVDEGRSVSLTGSAGPPITKAWIELFHAVDFGGPHFSTFYPVVEFADHDLDDFDDFFTLEQQVLFNPGPPPSLSVFSHNDKARSWKWFAPEGGSIMAFDHRANNSIETRTLVGDGFLHNEDIDLAQVLNDHGDDDMGPGDDGKGVDAVDFLAGCAAYYAAPVDLQWDLDVNGSYETTGSPVTFNAIAFDGPDVVEVPAQALHSRGGQPGQTTARVTVRNVAPELTQFRVSNGAGEQVNVDVPFVLTDLPVTVSADFSDPGVLDHQTATLDWGDGTVDTNAAFTTFDEAFGDATGAVLHAHIYTLSGSYPIALSVADDDGGADAELTVVRVVTPEQAVVEIVGLLDDIIASTTDKLLLRELQKARKALVGSIRGESANGALAMIRAGLDPAAIAFMLEQAIFRLLLAQELGADVGVLIALLEQVAAALAAT